LFTLFLGNLKRSRPIAIHYIREQLPHRRGGNNMYGGSDSNRSFCDWVPAPWNKQLELHSNYFAMNNGVLTVRESGLYFIYAQVGFDTFHMVEWQGL
jgi:TNF(Tumour Necrosis Factor) family